MVNHHYYDVFIPKRPDYDIKVIGKRTLLGRLGLAVFGKDWDIVAVRKVKK